MNKLNKSNQSILYFLSLILMMLVMIPTFTYGAQNSDDEYKVVGYYSGSLFYYPVEQLQTDKLTHVMYAFLIPADDGTCVPLEKPEQLKQLVTSAHANGAKVYIAIGGWSYQNVPLVTTFEKIAGDDVLLAKFVDSVMECVREYQLDGVELDWEHPTANSAAGYETMVLALYEALEKEGKAITAAVNGAWSTTAGPETSNYVSEKCLDAFEFICVMGYDMNNEEHSPFWFASTSVDYWLYRDIPKEKIVLGMPLYARPSWIQYRHLVEMDPENAYNDYAATQPLESYYNGLNTLCKKSVMAYEKAGGVMLFDVNEDTVGEYSVVSMIDDTIDQIETNGYLTDFAADAIEQDGGIRSALAKVDDIDVYLTERDQSGTLKYRWIYMSVKPIIKDNRTLVPIRPFSAKLGLEVMWNNVDKTVSVKDDQMEVSFTIGSDKVTKKSLQGAETRTETLTLDCPAQIIEGRTMIPLRFVSENFGYPVDWIQEEQEIVIHVK